MAFLIDLWLPIVLSAVLVFVVSSVLHMVLQLHKNDYKRLAAEEKVMDAIRAGGVEPATYMFPSADSMKEAYTPEMIEKFKRGPVGFLTVIPSGPPTMGKALGLWFGYSLLIGLLVAYVAWHTLQPGAEYLQVFRLTGTAAMLAYAVGNVPDSIWRGQSWATTGRHVVDGVVYGLMTAGAFAGFWPDA